MKSKQQENTVYSIQSFLEVAVASWGTRLKAHHLACMQEEASYAQRKAWFDCFNILRRELLLLDIPASLSKSIFLIFEYELPRERGRRPDVLLLSGKHLLVLEFKGFGQASQAHVDQAKHYARDLRSYHQGSHALQVVPFLVLAGAQHVSHTVEGVQVVSGDLLHRAIRHYLTAPFSGVEEWFHSEYVPLPSLLQSAQLLFKENAFPQLRKAHSAGIPAVLWKLNELAQRAKIEGSHHLALITGVPGAGKTLVGLQFVFETYAHGQQQQAVFLSGNGPLVEVLQYSLRNRNYVQSVHGFLKQYAYSEQLPCEDVIIYDEAQRAWDAERVAASKRPGSNSEPTDFLGIGNKKSHCLLIGLIGEGQEIYLGEESGMALWQEAVAQSEKPWVVHSPSKLQHYFSNAAFEVVEPFNLTTSLRTHQAQTLQTWVEHFLEGRLSAARDLSERLYEEDYPLYVTHDLASAKQYVREKYEDEPSKTYGLIASSKYKLLPSYGVQNGYEATKSFTVSQYYVDHNHRAYCKNLQCVVTEFSCQGLELDMPVLAWDADFIYENGWRNLAPMAKAKDPDTLRKNSYRVLLTRGRDGLVIFVPAHKQLNTTYEALLQAGCKEL